LTAPPGANALVMRRTGVGERADGLNRDLRLVMVRERDDPRLQQRLEAPARHRNVTTARLARTTFPIARASSDLKQNGAAPCVSARVF
jgi:hypothetical protein